MDWLKWDGKVNRNGYNGNGGQLIIKRRLAGGQKEGERRSQAGI